MAKRSILAVVLLSVAVGGVALVGIGPAGATTIYSSTGRPNTTVYAGPHTSDKVNGYLGYQTDVVIACQDYGSNIGGSTIWDKLATPQGGGWISDYFVDRTLYARFTPGIPRCSAAAPPPPVVTQGLTPLQALSRASAQIGLTTQPAGTEFAGLPWANYCDHFVAYIYGEYNSGHATAIVHWNYLVGIGYAHPGDTNPPFGALVFYNLGADGHVAFSIGGGQIITTPSAGSAGGVYVTTIDHFGSYLGWATPDPGW